MPFAHIFMIEGRSAAQKAAVNWGIAGISAKSLGR